MFYLCFVARLWVGWQVLLWLFVVRCLGDLPLSVLFVTVCLGFVVLFVYCCLFAVVCCKLCYVFNLIYLRCLDLWGFAA